MKRLQSFSRRVPANATRRSWYLQLDIRSFFPSIDRRLLLEILQSRLANEEMRRLLEVVVLHDPEEDAIFTCSLAKWEHVPPHKSLFHVPAGKGLPIGNLTSQFFANVYLDGLDQFIKHALKARFYLRYVDDLVLLNESREQLLAWKLEIAGYLEQKRLVFLHRNRQRIRPVSNGINFVGYITRPSHFIVRRRTVDKCKRALAGYQRDHVSGQLTFLPNTATSGRDSKALSFSRSAVFLRCMTGAVRTGKSLGLKRIVPRGRFYARCGIPARLDAALLEKLWQRDFMIVREATGMRGRVIRRVASRIHISMFTEGLAVIV